jgi:hypothetical protein
MRADVPLNFTGRADIGALTYRRLRSHVSRGWSETEDRRFRRAEAGTEYFNRTVVGHAVRFRTANPTASALTCVEQQRFPLSGVVVLPRRTAPRLLPFEAGYVPFPVRGIFCTLLRAESLIDKVPVLVPVCVGEKVTLMVQCLPVVSWTGQ